MTDGPAEGTTVLIHLPHLIIRVSTTVPPKGTTSAVLPHAIQSRFQLPCPRRARLPHVEELTELAVSTTVPAKGTTLMLQPGARSLRVSTTVPAKGTTRLSAGDNIRGQFQLPCPRRARPSVSFSTRRRACFNYRAREGHDGVTVLYGNTNIFFPILREVCDLRICMVLCL